MKVSNTMKIPELNIEVTKPIEWTKTIGEIIAPKGWRVIKQSELFYILDKSKYMNDFLGDFKGKWNLFYCTHSNEEKTNGKSGLSGLDLDGDLGLYSDWNGNDLAYSDGDGRVAFARDLK